MADARVRRLNWGSAGDVAAGWINSDIKQSPRIDLTCDIREGLALQSETLDYVVSIHALQEIPYDEVIPALQELRRVLKPGGVLRLVLPDMTKALDAYARGDRGYFLVPDEDVKSLGGKLIVQLLWYGYSRTLFTYDFIEELARKSGFRDVTRCNYKQTRSPYPEITMLDNRERESLFVEAVR